jgi:hypothetical protein
VFFAQKRKSNIAIRAGQGRPHQNSSAARNPLFS